MTDSDNSVMRHEISKTSNHQNTSNKSIHVLPPTATIDLRSLVSENQCIKLVPSVEDIFKRNCAGFDSTLDENSGMWLHKLQDSWNTWKKSAHIIHLLYDFFEKSDNPFSITLIVVINCKGFTDCKPNTLPYIIVEQLKVWSSKNPDVYTLLSSNLKLTAFNIAKEQKNFSFVKLISETYRIADDNKSFLPYVRSLLDVPNYKSAYQCIIALKLQEHIVIEDLLVPLVFQDKVNLLDEYLSTCPEQASALVHFLDNLLDRNESIRSKVDCFLINHSIPDVNWAKLHNKPLGKLITRLCNVYNVPLHACQNLTRNRAIGGIRFLIHQKYHENVISENAWNDLVIDTLSDKPELAEELVILVNKYDTKEASKWAQYFNLPLSLCPENVTAFLELQNETTDDDLASSPSTSGSGSYHTLSLTGDRIIFIDTSEAFKDAVYNGLVGEAFIGIDSEWKPSFGTKRSTVSLVQIATSSKVYLFDALALSELQYADLWVLLTEKVLDNDNVLKIGFGIENDIREMKASIPGLNCIKYKGRNYLELLNLYKAILNHGIEMPHQKKCSGEGLSAVVEQCFGKGLKKHEQCSNWENRPLRTTQLEYAALDAFVLVEIYSIFESICNRVQLNIVDLCFQVLNESEQTKFNKSKKKSNRYRKYTNSLQGPNSHPVSVENVKLLLDTSLAMLAAYLRSCGVDTIVNVENTKWENCVKTAASEKRFIVVNKSDHKRVSKEIPINHVYVLRSRNVEEQLKEIFVYFNILLQPSNIFRRCQVCNSDDITVISQQTMKYMADMTKLKANVDSSNICNTQSFNRTNSSDGAKDSQSASSTNNRHCDASYNVASTSDTYDEYDGYSEDEEDYMTGVLVHQNLTLGQEQIYKEKCLTRCGAPIHVHSISESFLRDNTCFHVCQICGKCYWKNGCLPSPINNVIFNNLSQIH